MQIANASLDAAVTGALTAHAFLPRSPVVPWVMCAVGGLLGWLYATEWRWLSRDWHMAALMVVGSLPPLVRGDHLPLLGAGWLAFGVGYACWQLDRRKSRWVGLWGHAVWHVATAVAIGLLFWAQR